MESMLETSRILEEVKKLLSRMPEGSVQANLVGSAVGSPTQALQQKLKEVLRLAVPEIDAKRLLVSDVGDMMSSSGASGYDVGLSLPVASDIWYLAVSDSILPFTGDKYQKRAQKIIDLLEPFFSGLADVSILKSIQSYADLSKHFSVYSMKNTMESKAPYVIREARFETWMLNRSTGFPSRGPKASGEPGRTSESSTSLGNLYAGMLAFPVGPMGVMEVLSVFSESMYGMMDNDVHFSADQSVEIEEPDNPVGNTARSLDGLYSPMNDLTGKCPGVHLVEKGYIIANRDTEYPAGKMGGYDDNPRFGSMRFYLRRDAKWPLPGEFIGLLAKPWPTHVWWFQESSPFLYAGNWIETNHYTSGIVREVLQEPIPGISAGGVYRCAVRGVDVCVVASDFYEYAVGERVAIIRMSDLGRFTDETKGNFKWKEMEDLIARQELEEATPSNDPYTINGNMMIVPISFY